MTIGNPPKLVGDFGEGLVTYALMRKGYLVACVDHVGADLIAEKGGYRIAVSVKTLLYRRGSTTTRGLPIRYDSLRKLEGFAKHFNLEPVVANVVGIADENIIHLFMMTAKDVQSGEFREVKLGYRLEFGKNKLIKTIAKDCVDYSCWREERMSEDLFKSLKKIKGR